MRCENKVTQYIPSGYSYKESSIRCGSTGVSGIRLFCDECESKQNHHPDFCKHGVRLTEFDCDCIECELGED